MVRSQFGRPPRPDAPAGRELWRRDPAAGGGVVSLPVGAAMQVRGAGTFSSPLRFFAHDGHVYIAQLCRDLPRRRDCWRLAKQSDERIAGGHAFAAVALCRLAPLAGNSPSDRDSAYLRAMIRIAISTAAFDAVVATLPLGSVGYENATRERYVWLEPYVVDRLTAMRGPGESYSPRTRSSRPCPPSLSFRGRPNASSPRLI